jgi:hypothetical protein
VLSVTEFSDGKNSLVSKERENQRWCWIVVLITSARQEEAIESINVEVRAGMKGGDWALSQNEQVSALAKLGGRFCSCSLMKRILRLWFKWLHLLARAI